MTHNIAVIGGSGAIAKALKQNLGNTYPEAKIHVLSSKELNANANSDNITSHRIDYHDEATIAAAADQVTAHSPLDMVLVASGMLHDGEFMPEKSLKELSAEKLQHLYHANTVVPALLAKHFLPHLRRDRTAYFAALSARVGSISDNRLGGWYAYRASKAALNMIIKNAAIEIGRRNKQAVVVGLHPGTVDSNLSKPFQTHVAEGKLFDADYSAARLLEVLLGLSCQDSGKCFAWDGLEIKP